jgi:hypothetical protein
MAEREPLYEKSFSLPLGYSFTARARPSTIRRTVIGLVPWAIYVMLPGGRRSKAALAVARKVSPLLKPKLK